MVTASSSGDTLLIDMKLTTITTLALICGSSLAVQAQETVPATPLVPAAEANKGSVKEQIEAITSSFNKEAMEFSKKLRAEKDRNKQQEMFKDRPDSKAAVDKVLALVKSDPKAEGVEEGLVWCVRRARGPQAQELLDIVLTHHNTSKALGSLAQNYSRMWGEQGTKELRMIVEKAGNDKIRQGATYYLASKLSKSEASKDEGIALMKKLQGVKDLKTSNPKLYKQIESDLFVAENLSLGCKAPDIVGKDQDDKEFKLSDYKGKVVLLDFWGIW